MRPLKSALAVLILFSCILAAGESAKSLFKKGANADAREDYEAAYNFYKAAFEKDPKNLMYKVPYERSRFLAGAFIVRRAQKLREQGKLQEALNLFQHAAEIDPSNDLAGQEIRRTKQMLQDQSAPSGETPPAEPKTPSAEDRLRRRVEQARPPVELAQLSDKPITGLRVSNEEVKVIYETLGKLAGINVLVDPDYASQSHRMPVDLQNVSLRDALDIVALESRTFWRPVTPNTIFVAADTPTKRKELEQNVYKTFYLSNSGGGSTANTDLTDVVTAIRTITEVPRIQHIPSQNAIIMKGTPDQIALAQKIIDDLDKAKPEVVIDIIVAQVNLTKARQLGLLPPQNASVALQGTTSSTTTTPATGVTTPATGNGLTFATLEHLTEGNFAVTADAVTAQLSMSSSDSKVLQNPRIRATDNEKASLKVSQKIPIATGSFGTPLGITGGASLGVNTQFTYQDVGVILEVTPHVRPDGEVTLKASLELSEVDGQSAPVGGISQPIIGQRKIEQVITLKDGEKNILGGILEDTYSKTTSGTPILGSIPILKYLFSQEQMSKQTNEILFILVPHIVRGTEFTDANRRPIDIGTQNAIEMRAMAKPSVPENSDQQASAPAPQSPQRPPVSQQGTQPSGGGIPTIAAPQERPAAPTAGSADAVSFRLDPAQSVSAQGSNVTLNVSLANGLDVYAVPLQIAYDPKVLQFVEVSNGDFLSKDGQTVPLPTHRNDEASGTLQVTATRPQGVAGVSGDGTVFKVVFRGKAKGSGVVSIAIPGARNSQNQPIRVQPSGAQAAITVN